MKKISKITAMILISLLMTTTILGCEYLPNFHSHKYQARYDESGHYKICNCGDIIDREEHILDWVIDIEAENDLAGRKHKECACGYTKYVDTPIYVSMCKNEDETLKLEEKLISTLSEFLRDFYISYEIPSFSFEGKINLCKNGANAIFATFSDKCYYVAAYCIETHDHTEGFSCYDKLTWVGFKNADQICEEWEEKTFVAAFQINPAELCMNILTNECDIVMEHFAYYQPEFKDGTALVPEISFDRSFIIITESDNKNIYYTSKASSHEPFSLDCTEIRGEYYINYLMNTQWNSGKFVEKDLKDDFGLYYEDLVKVMITDKYSETDDKKTSKYGLFRMEDISTIITK